MGRAAGCARLVEGVALRIVLENDDPARVAAHDEVVAVRPDETERGDPADKAENLPKTLGTNNRTTQKLSQPERRTSILTSRFVPLESLFLHSLPKNLDTDYSIQRTTSKETISARRRAP